MKGTHDFTIMQTISQDLEQTVQLNTFVMWCPRIFIIVRSIINFIVCPIINIIISRLLNFILGIIFDIINIKSYIWINFTTGSSEMLP